MLAKKAKEVLVVLQNEGLLKDLVLIGSWCCHFYISYFGRKNYVPTIQTLDIDLLIPDPRGLRGPARSVEDILKKLDFDAELTFSGWLRFVHPDLRVEFLIPRLGPQSDDPKKIPSLKITAMPLRHTSVLTRHAIVMEEEGLAIRVPHPAAFALHKLMISHRRKDKAKRARDKEMALRILDVIQATHQTQNLPLIWDSFTKKEKKEILEALRKEKREDLLELGLGSPS